MQDAQRARQVVHHGQVQVLQQVRRPRQTPGGQRGAAELGGKPALHPAAFRMHAPAQHEGRRDACAQADELRPGQRCQVQAVGQTRRGDDGGEHMQQHRGCRHASHARCAAARRVVAFLLEREHLLRGIEGVLAPAGARIGQPVEAVERDLRDIEILPVLSAAFAGGRVDDEQRPAYGARVLDHLGRAALAARGLPVPDGDEQVRAVDGLEPAVEVGVHSRAALGADGHMLGAFQQRFDATPVA